MGLSEASSISDPVVISSDPDIIRIVEALKRCPASYRAALADSVERYAPPPRHESSLRFQGQIFQA